MALKRIDPCVREALIREIDAALRTETDHAPDWKFVRSRFASVARATFHRVLRDRRAAVSDCAAPRRPQTPAARAMQALFDVLADRVMAKDKQLALEITHELEELLRELQSLHTRVRVV